MTEIVDALRTGQGPTENGKRDAWVHQTMQSAADEIERLRTVLSKRRYVMQEDGTVRQQECENCASAKGPE